MKIISHNFYVRCIGTSMYFICFHTIKGLAWFFHGPLPSFAVGSGHVKPIGNCISVRPNSSPSDSPAGSAMANTEKAYHGGSSSIGLDHVG